MPLSLEISAALRTHRIERCSVSTTEYSHQWARCTGCDFESEFVPIKGVNWDELQADIAAEHGAVVVAALGLTEERPKTRRQYVPAYRAGNGNVLPIGATTVSAHFAEQEAETLRSAEDETEVFVAYRDLPEWVAVDGSSSQ